jgi:hypothetical protein
MRKWVREKKKKGGRIKVKGERKEEKKGKRREITAVVCGEEGWKRM